MQDIADALNISRVTVWKVFSRRDGVSKELQHKIISKALEIGYNVPDDLLFEFKSQSAKEQYTISVTVSRPETSVFWMSIIHKIAKEASNYNINLMYIYLPSEAKADYVLPAVLTNGTVQGMIVLNIYNEDLIRKLSKLSMPKIFMDTATQIPFRELNGDLLLIEGKSCIMEIVKKLIQHGKSHIGFIGDINYAQTNYERYLGFLHALEEYNLPLQSQYCLTKSIGIDSYEEMICTFLDRLNKLPEAFICVSDYVASILCIALEERGYRVPEDVAVSGFDGSTEIPAAYSLTTVQVHNTELGNRLIRQLMYRMEHPRACYEICYLCSDVIFRRSTEF